MREVHVLIAGAGPTGLALAVLLARDGVEVEIVDAHAGPLEATKSAALHARTLEHLRTLGVADRVLAEGARVDLLTLRTQYRDRLTVDFRTLTGTRYPHMVDIPQNRTEHILIDRLAELGVTVRRETRVLSFTDTSAQPDDSGAVVVTLQEPDGSEEQVRTGWLVGCDGVHSTTRQCLGLDFVGDAYADPWALADAELDWPLPRNEMTFSGDTDGIFGVFPLPGRDRYRIAYTQHTTAAGTPIEPDLDDAQRALSRTGLPGRIRSVEKFWTFDLAHRQATRYHVGRVFLVGDAAHVHTPFGGQGLNLGIGDVASLGWRLSAVARGTAPAALLDSYEAERLAVGQQVIAFTHLGASAMLLRDDPRHHARDLAMTALGHIDPVTRLGARRLSQLAHTYRHTPAVTGRLPRAVGSLIGPSIRGGDRLPDLEVYDTLTSASLRLHDLLLAGGHTLLLTGTDAVVLADAARGLVAMLERSWGATVRRGVTVVALTSAVLTDAPGLTAPTDRVVVDRGCQAAVLYRRIPMVLVVRPDGHIGHAGPAEPTAVDAYLRTVALRPTAALAP